MAAAKQPAIHAALLDVRKALSGLTPGTKHQQGYKYRSSEQVYQRLTQALVDAGVDMSIEILERTTDMLPREKKAPAWRVTLLMRLHFVALADGSTTWSDTIGESIDYADKCSMQAMTVGVKYGVVHKFTVSEAEVEDPDADKTEAPEPPKDEPTPAHERHLGVTIEKAPTSGIGPRKGEPGYRAGHPAPSAGTSVPTSEEADAQMDLARAGKQGEGWKETAADEMAAEAKMLEGLILDPDTPDSEAEPIKKRCMKFPDGLVRTALQKIYRERWPK